MIRGRTDRTAAELAAISLLAFAIALLFFAYLSPGRLDYFSDQRQYEYLAGVIASTGTFGRFVDGHLVAEYTRTLGYPLLLAGIAKVAGELYPAAAVAQALLVACLPLTVFLLARGVLSTRLALTSALATALHPMFAYWAVYTMTDLFSTLLVTVGTLSLFSAVRRASLSRALFAGACFGYAGLTRPTLAFAVVTVVIAAFVVARVLRSRDLAMRVLLATLVTGLAFGVIPSYLYTALNFGRFGPTGAPPGVQLRLGYWQWSWPGRLNERLEDLARQRASQEVVYSTARDLGLEPSRASKFVAEARTEMEWPTPDFALGWPTLDIPPGASAWALEVALEDIRGDVGGFVLRGVTARSVALWVGAIPLRYEQINSIPRVVLLAFWAAQALVLALAALGVAVLLRRGRESALAGALIVALFVYISAIHFPFFSDPRFSLVAQPVLLMAAVLGAERTVATIKARFAPR